MQPHSAGDASLRSAFSYCDQTIARQLHCRKKRGLMKRKTTAKAQSILEIGPGKGAITNPLLDLLASKSSTNAPHHPLPEKISTSPRLGMSERLPMTLKAPEITKFTQLISLSYR